MNGDVLFVQVEDTIVGVGLLISAMIALVWGLALIAAAFDARNHLDDGCRLPRLRVIRRFGFWLGLFLVVSDAGIYTILGVQVLRSPEPTELWTFVYILATSLIGVVAFVLWARERAIVGGST